MKRILIFLIFTQFTLVQYGQIIADHTAVDKYDDIPQYYINEVKKMLLVVAGESHSLGYMRGLVAMESSFPAYDVNYTDTPEAYTTSHLRISRTTWGDVNNITGWINSYGEEDWYTSTTAINRTKAGISYYNTQGIPMSAFGFGHCYGDGGTDYITATQSYIDYCTTNGISTKVYFTTGAVDTYDAGYDKYLMHKQIRDYVNLNSDRILFDYADILCYDDGNPVEYTITDNGHTIQAITPKNNYPDGPSHISSAGELRLAKAMWWMLARIAGWNGNVTTIPVTSITISGGTAITTDGGTLQLSSSVLPANATNKTITWSISSGTDKASISATGLVTALDNGTATAKATAADGSGVFGTATIIISNQVNISIVNEPPVIVVNYQSSSYSGFVSEIDASGSYDVNKDNLTYSWIVPNNVPVSSTTGSILKYLGPVVSSSQTIEFTLSVNDGKTIQSKVFSIEIFPYKPELEVAEISDIKASSFQPPYYAYNIIDGNIGTMWAANGDNQWLIVGLKHSFKVQHIKLAFLQGQKRESYFDILGSKDSINWEPILIKSASCFFSGDLQVFEFPPSKSEKEFNYIKLIGLGNSADTWNYISELKIFGYKHRNTPNYDKLAVKVYPNPAKKYVTFRIDEQLLAPDHIQLLNLSGTVVFNRELDPYLKEFTVPLDLKNGIYIVTLESDNIILFTQKLIVSN